VLKRKFDPAGERCLYLGAVLQPGGLADGSAYCVPLAHLREDHVGLIGIRQSRNFRPIGLKPQFPLAEAKAAKLKSALAGGQSAAQAEVEFEDEGPGIANTADGSEPPSVLPRPAEATKPELEPKARDPNNPNEHERVQETTTPEVMKAVAPKTNLTIDSVPLRSVEVPKTVNLFCTSKEWFPRVPKPQRNPRGSLCQG
jgi:hypothetical protein